MLTYKLNRKYLRKLINEVLSEGDGKLIQISTFKKKYPQAYKAWNYSKKELGIKKDLTQVFLLPNGYLKGKIQGIEEWFTWVPDNIVWFRRFIDDEKDKNLKKSNKRKITYSSTDPNFKKKYPQAYKAWYRSQPRSGKINLVDIEINQQDGTMTGWTDEDESGYGSSISYQWNGKNWIEN